MQASSRGIRLALMGWGGVIVFAVLVAIAGEPASAAVFALIAAVIALWLWRSGGRAALWVSLIVGLLFAFEQAAYSVGDLGGGAASMVGDLFGLAVGVAIIAGCVMALLAVRRAPACC